MLFCRENIDDNFLNRDFFDLNFLNINSKIKNYYTNLWGNLFSLQI